MATFIHIKTALLLTCLALPAYAFTTQQQTNEDPRSWLILAQQTAISKAQAIDIVSRKQKGKVLSADLIQTNQRSFYKVKVLTEQGRIKTLHVDAQAKRKKSSQ
jgi:uncharacterized membrane protein YkoI